MDCLAKHLHESLQRPTGHALLHLRLPAPALIANPQFSASFLKIATKRYDREREKLFVTHLTKPR